MEIKWKQYTPCLKEDIGSFGGKRVLVTGGTGTLGKTVVNRLISGKDGIPSKITIFSRDETKQNDFRIKLLNKQNSTEDIVYSVIENIKFVIGDIRNYNDVCSVLRNQDIVINAAALKQVPSCEYFPSQAIQTNCLGPINIVNAIVNNNLNIETVVAVSTDKGCKPLNVMGMTKALQEKIFIAANLLGTKTKFVCVRYGNVLASRGSVVPLFIDQIKNKYPVTITHEDMTRFLFNVEQAIDVIVAAIKYGKPGEICVPHLKSAKMTDVIKVLADGKDVEIKNIGIRPGEKVHEIMISEEEARNCRKENSYFFISPLIPELKTDGENTYEYSSKDNLIGIKELKELFIKEGFIK